MVDYIGYINNNVEPSRRIEYAKGLVDYYKSIKPYLPKATKSSKRIVIIGEKRYSY